MKISFVTETYPPEINGVALTVESLVHNCRRLGHQVELIRPKQTADLIKAPERLIVEQLLPSARLPFYAGLRFGLPAKRRLLRLWQENRPEGVYVATEGPLGWSAVSAANQLGIPVVTGLHTRFDDFMTHYGLGFLSRPAFAFMRAFHNRALLTLVPTTSLKNFLRSKGFRCVERLPRAVDSTVFSPEFYSESTRTSWGCTAAPAILFVGRIASEKNLPLAVRAFNAIANKHPQARMIWVGDGPECAALKASLAADERHVFLGMLRGAPLSAAYASADLFLFPSLSETYGNVTLEALASGLAVCAFNYGAAEEFVKQGNNGQLARFGDEAEFVDQSLRLAQAICDQPAHVRGAARASVKHLDPCNVAGALVALFQGISNVDPSKSRAICDGINDHQNRGANNEPEYERI